MVIAVACDGLKIAPTFVQSSSYMCYEIEDDQLLNCRNIPSFDRPPELLPQFFKAIDAAVLIVGRIDPEVSSIIAAQGIEVVSDKKGDPQIAVRAYLALQS